MTSLEKPVGILLVGITGVGKDYQITFFLERQPETFIESQSVTTRKERKDDIVEPSPRYPEGRRKYRYITKACMREMFEAGKLVEYKASQGSNEYGTPYEAFDRALVDDKIVLTDINYQGAESVYEVFGGKIRIIYLYLDVELLEGRYRQRCEETGEPVDEQDLRERIEKAQIENAWAMQFGERLESECPGVFYHVNANGTKEEVTKLLADVFLKIFIFSE